MKGIVIGGRLRQRRQRRRLGNIELIQRLVEIRLRCGPDSVAALPEVDRIQIEFEDTFLAQRALDAQCEQRLLHLAAE